MRRQAPFKRLKNRRLNIRPDARPGIGHKDTQASVCIKIDLHQRPTLRGKFQRIGQQIGQTLAQALGVKFCGWRNFRGNLHVQRQTSRSVHLFKQGSDGLDLGCRIGANRPDGQPVLPNRGHIQNVIQNGRQPARRGHQHPQPRAAGPRCCTCQFSLAHADDRVQRGAQFMAHLGQKPPLGLIRRPRRCAPLNKAHMQRVVRQHCQQHKHRCRRDADQRQQKHVQPAILRHQHKDTHHAGDNCSDPARQPIGQVDTAHCQQLHHRHRNHCDCKGSRKGCLKLPDAGCRQHIGHLCNGHAQMRADIAQMLLRRI